MQQRGFIFSLDAYVAFTLSMVIISLLIFIIGTPKPFYPQLEQGHQLAHDSLWALAHSSDGTGGGSYLEQVLAGNDVGFIMREVVGGDPALGEVAIIPKGYGFALQSYDFASESWANLYNSSSDAASDRHGLQFTKLQASSTMFNSFYEIEPNPGESPFCYLSCRGYNGLNPDGSVRYANPCNVTPCSMPNMNFLPGSNSVRLVRLIVFA